MEHLGVEERATGAQLSRLDDERWTNSTYGLDDEKLEDELERKSSVV